MRRPDLTEDVRRQIALDPPRYRGVLHTWSIPVALLGVAVAIGIASSAFDRSMVAIYGLTLVSMFTFSAAFHRIRWTDDGWWRMRQLDHTGIYLVIAGSFTGIGGPALEGGTRIGILLAVWAVTAAGIAYIWSPLIPPFGVMTALYVLLAAMVVFVLRPLSEALGTAGLGLLLAGCGVYFVGALCLGARVPDPWPRVFGYHEVWHVLVVIASVMHYIVVVRYALAAS